LLFSDEVAFGAATKYVHLILQNAKFYRNLTQCR
jgi:hypothetical protein